LLLRHRYLTTAAMQIPTTHSRVDRTPVHHSISGNSSFCVAAQNFMFFSDYKGFPSSCACFSTELHAVKTSATTSHAPQLHPVDSPHITLVFSRSQAVTQVISSSEKKFKKS
jgi:hypothetical protein